MAKSKHAQAPIVSRSPELDERQRQAIRAALQKQKSGQRLTVREDQLLRKHEQHQRERYGQAYLRAMPKRHYLAATGVANKVILEQSHKLGLPWQPHEKTVNVGAMLARFHEMIAENPHGFYAAVNSAAVKEFFPDLEIDYQRECFKEKYWELADKRLIRRRQMLDALAVAEIHARMGQRWKDLGETLAKISPDALRAFLQAYDDNHNDTMLLLSIAEDERADNNAE